MTTQNDTMKNNAAHDGTILTQSEKLTSVSIELRSSGSVARFAFNGADAKQWKDLSESQKSHVISVFGYAPIGEPLIKKMQNACIASGANFRFV